MFALLPLKGLHSAIGHLDSIGQVAYLLDALDALCPIRVKEHAKELRHKVVEELAALMPYRLTVGTAGDTVAYTARAHLTPGSLRVVGTTGTLSVK